MHHQPFEGTENWFNENLPISQEQMKERYDFWAGGDIEVEPVITKPQELLAVSLLLNKACLPDIKNLSLSTLHLLQKSIRSCYAQSGIEIIPEIGKLTPEDIDKIKAGETIGCPAMVLSHSLRPINLKGRVMRFFWTNTEACLIKNNLIETVRDKMAIKGIEGKDWWFGEEVIDEETKRVFGEDVPRSSQPSDALTLCLKIQEKRLWYPPGDEPISVDSRADLAKHIEPIPDGIDPYFIIGETPWISFPKDIVGVLNLGAHDRTSARHAHSPLIDPGFEGPIRLELINGPRHPDYVELLIYQIRK